MTATVTLQAREARLALALALRMAARVTDGYTLRECNRLANVLRTGLDGLEDAKRAKAREYAVRQRERDPEAYATRRRESVRRYLARKRAVA